MFDGVGHGFPRGDQNVPDLALAQPAAGEPVRVDGEVLVPLVA
ncbi:hypothetical protein [Amycolatopsis sp. NPDC049159]